MSEHQPSANGHKHKCGECAWFEPRQNGRGAQCFRNPPVVFPNGFVDRPSVGAHDKQCASFLPLAAPTKEDVIREGAAAAAAMVARGAIPVKAAVRLSEGPRGKRNT